MQHIIKMIIKLVKKVIKEIRGMVRGSFTLDASWSKKGFCISAEVKAEVDISTATKKDSDSSQS